MLCKVCQKRFLESYTAALGYMAVTAAERQELPYNAVMLSSSMMLCIECQIMTAQVTSPALA